MFLLRKAPCISLLFAQRYPLMSTALKNMSCYLWFLSRVYLRKKGVCHTTIEEERHHMQPWRTGVGAGQRGGQSQSCLLLELQGLCHHFVLVILKSRDRGGDWHNGALRTTDALQAPLHTQSMAMQKFCSFGLSCHLGSQMRFLT